MSNSTNNTSNATLLDRVISYVSPTMALQREVARKTLASYRGTVAARTDRSWEESTSSTGQRIPLPQDQRSSRNRARALERKNPIAAGALDRCVENVIGTGIQPEPRTDSPEFNEEAMDWWTAWCRQCDVYGLHDFNGLQRMLFRSQKRDGDVGAVLIDDGYDGKLQTIEGDHIKSPLAKYTGGLTVDGVELDAAGRPVRFWVESIDPKTYKATHTSIEARDFILLANRSRLTDIRGMTAFITNFGMFDMIMGYCEDTVTMSRLATWFSIFIQKNNPQATLAPLATTTNASGEVQRLMSGEPGQIMVGKPGEEPKMISPAHPTQSFPDALAAFVRPVGLAFGIPLEQLLFDWSRANYTVSRAIKMQIQRSADIMQQEFAAQFVSRVYQWAISKAVKNGRFKSKVPDLFWKHEWIPQPLAMVDPIKEIAAAAAAIELGVDARTFVARGMGYRFTDLVEQNKADRKLMTDAGLPVDTNKTAAQLNQPSQQADQQDQPPGQQQAPEQSAVGRLLAMLPEHNRENP